MSTRTRDLCVKGSGMAICGFMVTTAFKEVPPVSTRGPEEVLPQLILMATVDRAAKALTWALTKPSCLDTADTNDDGTIDVADAVTVLSHLFAGSGPLPAPFNECGIDPTADDLDCESFEPRAQP